MQDPSFIVYPAIDLREGRVVRLRQGDPTAETTFAQDPVEVALRWQRDGATWLHVVNLDGALGLEDATHRLSANLDRLQAIAAAVTARVQFGGGIRTLADIEQALGFGAQRVVLGTVAVQNPSLLRDAVALFGADRIVVALDAREGKVVTHGWQEITALSAPDVALRMAELGVQRLLYTDVARDGMLSGANVDATALLAQTSGLAVIASGGVAGAEDVAALARRRSDGIEGVVVGQALYTGAVRLDDALRIAAQSGA